MQIAAPLYSRSTHRRQIIMLLRGLCENGKFSLDFAALAMTIPGAYHNPHRRHKFSVVVGVATAILLLRVGVGDAAPAASASEDEEKPKTCEYDGSNEETKCHSLEFEQGKTVNLDRYGTKLDLSLVRGPIYANTFPLLPGIKDMTIRSSNISDIEPGFFECFPHLESLIIKINHGFPNITSTIFRGCCPKLTTFKIYDNNFRYFDNKVFKGMGRLEVLWIEKQDLGPLEANYFQGLTSLKRLRLQHCRIKQIDVNAFDDLTKLEKLELPTNEVQKIQPGTFKKLNKLEELQLFGNSINNFTGGEFDGLTSLKRLELVGNKISSLNLEKILENLPKLERVGIKLTLIECDRAKSMVERMQENNIEIKNVNEVLADRCQDD